MTEKTPRKQPFAKQSASQKAAVPPFTKEWKPDREGATGNAGIKQPNFYGTTCWKAPK
jgi:hypothetical protein